MNYQCISSKEIYNSLDEAYFNKLSKALTKDDRDIIKHISLDQIDIKDFDETDSLVTKGLVNDLLINHNYKVEHLTDDEKIRTKWMYYDHLKINDIVKYKYKFKGKAFEVMAFERQKLFFQNNNPWEVHISDAEIEVSEFINSKKWKSGLSVIKELEWKGVKSDKLNEFKKLALSKLIGFDALIMLLILVISLPISNSLLRKTSLNGEEALDFYIKFFLLTFILCVFVIHKRHKNRKNE